MTRAQALPTPLDQREAELFAGREAELALFEDRFDPPPARDERRVLMLTGVGGIGKSALARRIVRKLQTDYEERPAAWAHIDFAEAGGTDPVQALLQIRLQLGAMLKGVRFPVFDVAFARYHQERYPSSDVRKQFSALDPSSAAARRLLSRMPDSLQDGDLWQGVTEGVVGLIGEVPLVGFGYQQLNKWIQRGEEWWDRRGRPLLGQLDQLKPDQIADHLPRCLGTDLVDAIESMDHRLPMAIIGDTAEAFHGGQGFTSGIGAFHNDAWLRELIWHSPGVLFVLLGRDPLFWHEHEHSHVKDWERIVQTRPVAPLGDADARRILVRFPVPEAAIRERMVAGAAGLPFYLGLQLDLYRDYLEAGQEPSEAAFGGTPDAIVTRFLNHLDQRVETSLVTLAHARRFDAELYRWLREKHLALVPNVSFPEVTRFSFVEDGGDGSRRLHQLMRDILTKRLAEDDPAERRAIHEALFAWWDARCQPEDIRAVDPDHERALEEAAHHLTKIRPECVNDWIFECQSFPGTDQFGRMLRLWNKALPAYKALDDSDRPEIVSVLDELSVLHVELDNAAVVREGLDLVLGGLAAMHDPDRLDATVMVSSLSDCLAQLGGTVQIKALLEQALGTLEANLGPDHSQTRTIRDALNGMEDGA